MADAIRRRSATTAGRCRDDGEAGAHLVELVRWIDQLGVELADVQLRRPSLEDVFIELTGKSLRNEGVSRADEERAALAFRDKQVLLQLLFR